MSLLLLILFILVVPLVIVTFIYNYIHLWDEMNNNEQKKFLHLIDDEIKQDIS